jgi:hypothetical protein
MIVHLDDVGVDLDRDASLAQQPHGRNSILGAFLNRLKQGYQRRGHRVNSDGWVS